MIARCHGFTPSVAISSPVITAPQPLLLYYYIFVWCLSGFCFLFFFLQQNNKRCNCKCCSIPSRRWDWTSVSWVLEYVLPPLTNIGRLQIDYFKRLNAFFEINFLNIVNYFVDFGSLLSKDGGSQKGIKRMIVPVTFRNHETGKNSEGQRDTSQRRNLLITSIPCLFVWM